MAKLSGQIGFTGTIGGLTAYTMKGSDKIIVRKKGGVSKKRIQQDPKFAMTRRYNEEWKACIAAARQINRAIFPIRHLADYNYTGQLNAICKSIQKDDTVSELGRRGVLLTQYYFKLEGFSINKENSFESIVIHPLQYNINRAAGTAAVEVPALIPGINLHNPKRQPMYRVVTVLGTAADIIFDQQKGMYIPAADTVIASATAATEWKSYKENTAASTLQLALANWDAAQPMVIILAAGIEFGIPVAPDDIRPVKYAGAGRVLKIG